MKTIKIIIGIITVITIGFFLTGLIVKDTKYSAEVSINKPLSEVFQTFNNSENIKMNIKYS